MTFRIKNMPGPPILNSAIFEVDTVSAINTRVTSYSETRYGHDDVREALVLIYGNKCAYCEARITAVATPNVDHFRPINSYATIINPQHHNGYYWLGYEWTNLIQACPSCNQIKSSKFHLNNPLNRQINSPALVAGIPDYPQHLINSMHLANEDPLLINPEIIDPDIHLAVDYYGSLLPLNNSVYGENTINICDLNRDGLYVERAALIDSFILKIETEIYERYRGDALALNNAQYQHRLNGIFKEIIAQQHIEQEYNMTARCILDQFDELILEDIEPIFRREVQRYLVDFLNNL